MLLGMIACLSATENHAVEFSRDVQPILAENCLHCHGPDAAERKADLRLDTADGAAEVLETELITRVGSNDPDTVMPPPDSGKQLTATEIEMLRKWIENGAEYEAHWAFRPIQTFSAPATDVSTLSEIDRFIVASLKERGLTLSPPTSRRKLIRRATFDLTGLPPSWADVEAFDNDPDPNAFEKVVDRLLASPTYGERWGRHWLDLARYADTHGGSAIGFTRFPFSYTYRDYVISAFNADLPYNRFILEQLAADQLQLEENDPALAALGFLTVGRQFRNRHDLLDDQIDVITRGLLGLTVSCARCHDHKFDPIPTTDYYSLHATLAASHPPRELPLVGDPEVTAQYQEELEKRNRLRNDLVREQGEVMRGRLRMQVGLYLRELAKGVPEQDTSTTFLSYRTEDLRPVVLEQWRTYLKAHDENDPVFGPWHRLSQLDGKEFLSQCQEVVQTLILENGDQKAFADEHRLATQPPKWNPRILEALEEGKPETFIEVADVYGTVFAQVHRNWLSSLLDASLEAGPGGTLVPDQDAKHKIVNSSIERQLRHHLYDEASPTSLSFDDPRNLTMLNRGVRDPVGGTLGAVENLNRTAGAPPRAMTLVEAKDETREAFVFLRGNPVARGEQVQPRFLTALSTEKPPHFSEGEHRLGLAMAITEPSNPLTRRVFVNWVWQHHFGQGLVNTPDDFGSRGNPPSHPELLDFLAQKLEEDGWLLKKLHRRIMLTSAYQQAATENATARKIDPDNALIWRMPTRRLEMEAMRDAMLAVSGELDLNPATMGGQPFEEKADKAIPRRSVYSFVNRDVISKLASTFDVANPSSCTVQRPETTVPQQTLFALNSDFIQNRAKALLQLPEIKKATTDDERLRLIYQRVYSRPPEADEVRLGLEYIRNSKDPDAAWSQFVHALLASNEFHFVD